MILDGEVVEQLLALDVHSPDAAYTSKCTATAQSINATSVVSSSESGGRLSTVPATETPKSRGRHHWLVYIPRSQL